MAVRVFEQQWAEDGTKRWTVYMAVAEDGMVLYVGMTQRGLGRVAEHGMRSWWPVTADMRLFHVETEEEARALEAQCITHYRPMFNIAGRPAGAPERIHSSRALEAAQHAHHKLLRDYHQRLVSLEQELSETKAELESLRPLCVLE